MELVRCQHRSRKKPSRGSEAFSPLTPPLAPLVARFPESRASVRLLGSPMSMRALADRLERLAQEGRRRRARHGAPAARLAARLGSTENFESAHVKSTLAAWGMHLDFAPGYFSGAVFPYLESMANQFWHGPGKGGADTMIRALEKCSSRPAARFSPARRWRDHHLRRQATGVR